MEREIIKVKLYQFVEDKWLEKVIGQTGSLVLGCIATYMDKSNRIVLSDSIKEKICRGAKLFVPGTETPCIEAFEEQLSKIIDCKIIVPTPYGNLMVSPEIISKVKVGNRSELITEFSFFYNQIPIKVVERETHVYFIQPEDGGPVKIGKADNYKVRLKQHQTSHWKNSTLYY
jgi:hypothetical protein